MDLTHDAGRFFYFFLMIFLTHFYSSAIFRLVGVASPSNALAQGINSTWATVTVALSGFTIAASRIPDWWIWFYWINPLHYCLGGLVVNEFRAPRWGSTGPSLLQAYSLRANLYWRWLSPLCYAGLVLIIMLLVALAEKVIRVPRVVAVFGAAAPPAAGTDAKPSTSPATSNGRPANATETPADTDSDSGASGAGVALKPGDPRDRPFVPVALSFSGLRYFVPHPSAPGQELELLRGLDGAFLPGTSTALLGPSGSGKTTLLDLLTNRKNIGRTEGRIALNGRALGAADELPPRLFSALVGYVEQMDIHAPALRVRESLRFSARLRLPRSTTRAEVEAFVDYLEEMLELRPIAGRLVGSLSLEQRKRLTLGVEMAASPSLLFLDEPTSGLGAREARVVATAIHRAASSGRTVITTIHQPSVHVFDMFSHALILRPGGEIIFAGPLGPKAEAMVAYFESIPGVPAFQRGGNPATYALELTAPQREDKDKANGQPEGPSDALGPDGYDSDSSEPEDPWLQASADRSSHGPTRTSNVSRASRRLSSLFGRRKPSGLGSMDVPLAGPADSTLPPAGPGTQAQTSQLQAQDPSTRRGLPTQAENVDSHAAPSADLAAAYTASALRRRILDSIASIEARSAAGGDADASGFERLRGQALSGQLPNYPASLWTQWVELFKRALLQGVRSPAVNFQRLMTALMLALVFGSIYYNQGGDSRSTLGLQSILGALYLSNLFLGVLNTLSVAEGVFLERSVFYRERAARMYSALPFASVQLLAELPYLLIMCIYYVPIVYALVQFDWTAAKFFEFFLVTFLNTIIFTSLAIVVVQLTPILPIAFTSLSMSFNIFSLLAGFVIVRPRIPDALIWMHWLDPLNFVLNAQAKFQLGSAPGLYRFGYNSSGSPSPWACVGILFGFVSTFHAIAYLALRFLNFQRR